MVRSIVLVLLAAFACFQAPGQNAPQEVPKDPQPANATPATAQVSPQVVDAEAAIVKSDWKAAESKLGPWLTTHPVDARALFDAGYVADAQDHLDRAVGFYRRAADADPKSFESHLMLGLLLARQGKLDEARPELVTATQLDPGDAGPALKARAWRALAEIDKPSPGKPGDATEASNDLLEALKLSPETQADTLLAASLAESSGQFDSAEAAYRRALSKDPNSAQANAGLAHVLMHEQKYADAEPLLRIALEKSPDDPGINAELATDLAAQDKAEALPLLQKLHSAHPADQAITRMLADVMAQAGDAAGSDQLYLHLLASNPNDPGLLLSHGQALIRQQKYLDALHIFQKLTGLDPADGNAWSGMAFAAMKIGQPEVTLHALTMRSKYLSEVPSTYFLWATSYDTLHEKAAAITYYHHFLDAAAGKYPDQEWQARQRLLVLEKNK